MLHSPYMVYSDAFGGMILPTVTALLPLPPHTPLTMNKSETSQTSPETPTGSYYDRNREERCAYQREHYRKNKERINAKRESQEAENPEKAEQRLTYNRAYYRKNRERLLKIRAEHYQKIKKTVKRPLVTEAKATEEESGSGSQNGTSLKESMTEPQACAVRQKSDAGNSDATRLPGKSGGICVLIPRSTHYAYNPINNTVINLKTEQVLTPHRQGGALRTKIVDENGKPFYFPHDTFRKPAPPTLTREYVLEKKKARIVPGYSRYAITETGILYCIKPSPRGRKANRIHAVDIHDHQGWRQASLVSDQGKTKRVRIDRMLKSVWSALPPTTHELSDLSRAA